jgi:MarR family transcriptional regulator, lower aerobic nicotinate degradation pathway regulator
MNVKRKRKPATGSPAPKPSRRFAAAMRLGSPASEGPEYPSSLLRYPSAALFLLMREAFRLGLERIERASTPEERMRFPHFAVLACLEEFGSASQREISERLRLDASDLVAFVDWLEDQRFVVRRRDPRDRRRYEVDLTSAGRHALRVRARSVDRMNDELFRGLEPEEREQFHALVLKAVRARATNGLHQRPKAQR